MDPIDFHCVDQTTTKTKHCNTFIKKNIQVENDMSSFHMA